MKVALVRVYGADRLEVNTADQNVGLGYLGAVAAREGADTIILDPVDVPSHEWDVLIDWKPDVVGFTVHQLNVIETLKAAASVKTALSDVVVVLGGHHATATAKEILADNVFIDGICLGEGELLLGSLLREIKSGLTASQVRKRGLLYGDTVSCLDSLPMPLRGTAGKVMRLITSRGCPYSCSFCTTPGLRATTGEPGYRARSPKRVVDELQSLLQLGSERVIFNDDIYIYRNRASLERSMEIAREILDRSILVEYKVQLRVDSVPKSATEALSIFRQSGLRAVFIGVESGSEVILKEYQKSASVKDAFEALDMFKSARIQVNAGNILASPDCSIEDMRESIKVFEALGLAYLFFRRITFRAYVFPGTVLETKLSSEGRLEGKARYMPRRYTFRDPAVGRVVERFEEVMPSFLVQIGGDLFGLRDRAIQWAYRQNEDDCLERLAQILNAWNRCAAALLLRWCDRREPPSQCFAAEFAEFVQMSKQVERELAKFVG